MSGIASINLWWLARVYPESLQSTVEATVAGFDSVGTAALVVFDGTDVEIVDYQTTDQGQQIELSWDLTNPPYFPPDHSMQGIYVVQVKRIVSQDALQGALILEFSPDPGSGPLGGLCTDIVGGGSFDKDGPLQMGSMAPRSKLEDSCRSANGGELVVVGCCEVAGSPTQHVETIELVQDTRSVLEVLDWRDQGVGNPPLLVIKSLQEFSDAPVLLRWWRGRSQESLATHTLQPETYRDVNLSNGHTVRVTCDAQGHLSVSDYL